MLAMIAVQIAGLLAKHRLHHLLPDVLGRAAQTAP